MLMGAYTDKIFLANSFAVSAILAVKLKIKPQRAQRTRRVMGNSFVLKAATESFAVPAGFAITLKRNRGER